MKKLFLIIFTFWCTTLYSQDDGSLSSRAQIGSLSYDECVSLANAGRLSEAIPSLLSLKKRYEQAEQYNGGIYYGVILALHYYYMGIGDFSASRDLLSEAGKTFNRMESEPNNEYIRSLLCCRGQLEVMLKNYGDALNYLNLAQVYFEEKNDYSEYYLVTMMNMALAYQANGDLLSAKIYMDEAIEQYENLHGSIYGIHDEAQFMVLGNYGYLNYSIGHEKEAEKCFLTVINNCKKTPFSYEAYALACNNLSVMYMKQGRWKDCVNLLEGLVGENNERNYMFAQNKALCHLFLREYSKSITSLIDMNNFSLINIENIFSHFTGLERENYWTEISKELIFINNLIAYHSHDSQAICTAYDNALFCKTLLVNSTKLIDRFVSTSSNSDLKQQYYSYQKLKNELAYKTGDRTSRDSLARDIIDVERTILNAVGNLGQWLHRESKTWQEVRQYLGEGEIAIEYCYAPRMEKYPDVQPYYGAFVLRKDFYYPILVSLENVDSVENVFDNENADELFINELYASDKAVILHKMLWTKLTPYLNGIKTVYYSPTGQLSNVNFDVLRGEDGVMLNERYSMNRVSSTANIGEIKAANSVFHSSVLYGNVKYDETVSEMAAASSTYSNFTGTVINSELALRSENERGKWGRLPSTKTEIDNIKALLTPRNIDVSVCQGDTANEESFKSLSGRSPEILHLATHGFVIDTPKKAEGNKFVASTSVYSQKDSYMMWAGLMLAGGNNIWQGKFDLTNVEDGILTADEISRMDLSNTKLVVLSACETARGKIDPVDGVYGLQRAFKMAGVGAIVMSLWKVQDESTSMLMTRFYTYLTSGEEKHQALWKATMDVREKYKDPYYWAGFIMLD